MTNNKKNNPIAVYSVVSHIAFIVITPLLIFVIGGTVLVDYLAWPEWADIIFVALGIMTMLTSAIGYLRKLIKLFDNSESGTGTTEVSHDRRDHDYYDDTIKKKRL